MGFEDKANWFKNWVEACSENAYYRCFDATTQNDPDPETTYEKWYGPLEDRIGEVLTRHGVPREATDYFDDWCPNRTRHVTIERQYLTPQTIAGLHALLDDDYYCWRIDVIVVNSIPADDRTGQLGIWRDWVLTWGCGRELLPTSSR